MNNIIKVFLSDWRRISTNVVALIMVMGLSILPSLYAWFNILSNWDPYGPDATCNIKVAVASDDKGVTIGGTTVNIADSVIEGLEANTTIGWVFTDDVESAVNGVYAGDYYAALIMPEDFTENMVSFLTDSMTHPQLIYYTNQKKNAIAPKITDKAKTAVQQQVNASFLSTLTESVLKVADTTSSAVSNDYFGNGANSGQSVVDMVIAKLETVEIQLQTYETLLITINSVIGTASSTAAVAGSVTPDFSAEQSALNELSNSLDSFSAFGTGTMGQLSSGISQLSGSLNSITRLYSSVNYSVSSFNESMSEMSENLNTTLETIQDLEEKIQTTIDDLTEFKNSGEYTLLSMMVAMDSEELSTFMASPLTMEEVDMFPIDNYGSAMSPFYTVLALWVGALITVAIIHVGVKSIEPNLKLEIKDLKPYQAFFGRYITFFIIGEAQAVLTALGDILYIGIQCVNPIKFVGACMIISFVFTMISYSLTFAFGNVGEALVVVIMVIQVAGAGGTFPIEVLPKVYQAMYRFMPFNYAMNALRECVGGLYRHDYFIYLADLFVFAIISVFIGLVLSIPAKKLNEMIEESKEKTGVML
jgi:putative membrane protein